MNKQVTETKFIKTFCGTNDIKDLIVTTHIKKYQTEAIGLEPGWYARLTSPGYTRFTEWNGPHKTIDEAYSSFNNHLLTMTALKTPRKT